MIEEILPCPFCGSIPKVENGFSPLESIYYVFCTNEDCQLSPIGKYDCLWFTIKEWNTRYDRRN